MAVKKDTEKKAPAKKAVNDDKPAKGASKSKKDLDEDDDLDDIDDDDDPPGDADRRLRTPIGHRPPVQFR